MKKGSRFFITSFSFFALYLLLDSFFIWGQVNFDLMLSIIKFDLPYLALGPLFLMRFVAQNFWEKPNFFDLVLFFGMATNVYFTCKSGVEIFNNKRTSISFLIFYITNLFIWLFAGSLFSWFTRL